MSAPSKQDGFMSFDAEQHAAAAQPAAKGAGREPSNLVRCGVLLHRLRSWNDTRSMRAAGIKVCGVQERKP